MRDWRREGSGSFSDLGGEESGSGDVGDVAVADEGDDARAGEGGGGVLTAGVDDEERGAAALVDGGDGSAGPGGAKLGHGANDVIAEGSCRARRPGSAMGRMKTRWGCVCEFREA